MNTSIDGGSKAYWAELRQAHGLINDVKRRIEELKMEQQYCGYVNADGDEVVWENTAPFERLEEAQVRLTENARAMEIVSLTNQTRVLLGFNY